MKTNIFVCYHNDAPKISSNCLLPMNVATTEGNNIATKGDHYGELRITYWAWKNAKADVVGLFHYRRFLNLKTSTTQIHKLNSNFCEKYGLTNERIAFLMNKYDVILPCKVPQKVKPQSSTVYDFYARHHNAADLDTTLQVLTEKYPEMFPLAKYALKEAKQSYCANIIIAKKPLFDEYAAWLFDILFAVEEKLQPDVLTRDLYQQRIYGFLSERLLGIFMQHKAQTADIKICEAPLLFVEANQRKHLRYCWREAKRKLLTIIGLGRKEWTYYVK